MVWIHFAGGGSRFGAALTLFLGLVLKAGPGFLSQAHFAGSPGNRATWL